MMKIKQSTTPLPPEPPPQPLPVPPEHCRWILLEDACGPNEKMLDFVATGPDGNMYKLCCDVTARKGTGTPGLAARTRPTTRLQRRSHKRALWRGLTRSPIPTTPKKIEPGTENPCSTACQWAFPGDWEFAEWQKCYDHCMTYSTPTP